MPGLEGCFQIRVAPTGRHPVGRAQNENVPPARGRPVKIVPNYLIIHYHKGIPLVSCSLCLTIEQLRQQGVRILKTHGDKKRIKHSLASKSLAQLTETIKFEQ